MCVSPSTVLKFSFSSNSKLFTSSLKLPTSRVISHVIQQSPNIRPQIIESFTKHFSLSLSLSLATPTLNKNSRIVLQSNYDGRETRTTTERRKNLPGNWQEFTSPPVTFSSRAVAGLLNAWLLKLLSREYNFAARQPSFVVAVSKGLPRINLFSEYAWEEWLWTDESSLGLMDIVALENENYILMHVCWSYVREWFLTDEKFLGQSLSRNI